LKSGSRAIGSAAISPQKFGRREVTRGISRTTGFARRRIGLTNREFSTRSTRPSFIPLTSAVTVLGTTAERFVALSADSPAQSPQRKLNVETVQWRVPHWRDDIFGDARGKRIAAFDASPKFRPGRVRKKNEENETRFRHVPAPEVLAGLFDASWRPVRTRNRRRLSKRNVNPFNSQRFGLFTYGIQAHRN